MFNNQFAYFLIIPYKFIIQVVTFAKEHALVSRIIYFSQYFLYKMTSVQKN